MSSISNPLSYTNKDFQSIYEELLSVAKQLSYRWDPTISNESDPGVVLLKLNAIIADKNNYNIDKNILETFVDTVTQDVTARQLFSQLGYKMPWYQSASTDIVFKWIGEELVFGQTLKIPKFTMLTNAEGNIVYTTTQPAEISFNTANLTAIVPALEGKIVNYSVAGSTKITTINFDSNNRIYLNDYNVAENGIFINNADNENIEWTMVDNIQLYPTGSYVFEFGIDARTNICYLEFPEDFHNLIGSGLSINYIVTTGVDGNVASKSIEAFFNNISVDIGNKPITLDAENMLLYNSSASSNGKNPQTIEDAFKSYKRIAGTFNTLVTLRDYMNAIYNSDLVSNAKVSDRLNDIQTTYTVVTDTDSSLNMITKASKIGTNDSISFARVISDNGMIPAWDDNTYYTYDTENHSMSLCTSKPESWEDTYTNYYVLYDNQREDLTAYDLRLYLLASPNVIKDVDSYNESFDLIPSKDIRSEEVRNYLISKKCVQHNFKDILQDKPCLFTNIYPLNIKIIPQYRLNDTQLYNLKQNIFKTLLENLNSRNINFGEQPDYDKIYKIIEQCDNRIKVVILDDFTFTTFATYWDGTDFKQVPISEFNAANILTVANKDAIEDKLSELSSDSKKGEYFVITLNNYDCYKIKFNQNGEIEGDDAPYSSKIKDFRTDIIAKSVLSGKTSLFDIDNRFKYTLDKNEAAILDGIDRISTEIIIAPFGGEKESTDKNNPSKSAIDESIVPDKITPNVTIGQGDNSRASFEVPKNVSIQFYAPSFKNTVNYSNYVKFMVILNQATGWEYKYLDLMKDPRIGITRPVYIHVYDNTTGTYKWDMYTTDAYVTGDDGKSKGLITQLVSEDKLTVFERVKDYTIPANTDYKLRNGDLIVFFWKESSEDDSPYVYKVYRGIEETDNLRSPIINANFTIIANSTDKAPLNHKLFSNDSGKIEYNNAPNSIYDTVSKFYGDTDLSGTKTINIRDVNEISLKKEKHSYYFITNTFDADKKNYEMRLSVKDSIGSYILKDDEYFLYTNSEKTSYEVLGSGTLLQFSNVADGETLSVDYLNPDVVMENGIVAFDSIAKILDHDMIIREQQIYNFTEGDVLHFDIEDSFYISEDKSDTLEYDGNGVPSYIINADPGTSIIDTSINVSDSTNSLSYIITSKDIDKESKRLTSLTIQPYFVPTRLSLNQSDSIDNTCLITVSAPENIGVYAPGAYYKKDSNSLNPDYILDTGSSPTSNSYYYIDISASKIVKDEDIKVGNNYYFPSINNNYIYRPAEDNDIAKNITAYYSMSVTEVTMIDPDHDSYYRYEDNEYEYELLSSSNLEGQCQPAYKITINGKPADKTVPTYEVFVDTDETINYNISWKVSKRTTTPIIKTGEMTSMKGISIGYELAGSDSTITQLPRLDIGEDLSWQATATYNVSSGFDKEQEIPAANPTNSDVPNNPYIILYKVNGEIYTCANQVVKVLSSATLSKVGGVNIDITYVDLFGNRQTVDLLFYTDNNLTNNGFGHDSLGNITLKMSGSDQTYSINNVKLDPNYFYMIPVRNKSDIGKYSVSISGGTQNSNVYTISEFGKSYGKGMRYFVLKNSDSSKTVGINIKIKSPDEQSELVIYPMLKYKDIIKFYDNYGITTKEIISRMKELDTDSEFKYNHIVNPDSAIPDPLSSKSFLDVNHIFNEYVLTKAEMDMVVGANHSTINVINNR